MPVERALAHFSAQRGQEFALIRVGAVGVHERAGQAPGKEVQDETQRIVAVIAHDGREVDIVRGQRAARRARSQTCIMMFMENRPQIGLTVLYNQGGTQVPAIIQSLGDGNTCNLFTIGRSATSFVNDVPFGTGARQWTYLDTATQKAGGH